MKESKITIFAYLDDWVPAGVLKLAEDKDQVLASAFSYGTKYLDRKNAVEVDPVDLGFSERAALKHKEIFPSEPLTYFGGIRDASPDAWGRLVIENKLKAKASDLLESDYLLNAGSDRVGALDIRRTFEDAPSTSLTDWGNLPYLMDAADRIDQGLPVPSSLEIIFENGSALGGARPKASIRDGNGILHLAKFSTSKDQYSVPDIEMATLKLASECGLTVPEVRIEQIGAKKLMLIRRFDRYFSGPDNAPLSMNEGLVSVPIEGGNENRFAFVSGLTLLNCHESESRSKSYVDLAVAVAKYCHKSVIEENKEQLFGRMIYNILVSNDDDHLRNHGFIFDPNIGGWRLSPLYDVTPRPGISKERTLHLGVGLHGRAATINNALTKHQMFGLSLKSAEEIIDNIYEKVREWKVYFEEYGVSGKDIDAVATAFRRMEDIRETPESVVVKIKFR